MASRSWKAGSYLASAQSPKIKPSRPHFTRTSSSSSTHSTHSTQSDDSFITTLKHLNTQKVEADNPGSSSSADTSPRCHTPGATPGSTSAPFDVTPGRKRSQPITIDRPARQPERVYTPLSARGDLPGGYFPYHDTPIKQYRSHPFSHSYHLHKTSEFNTTRHTPTSLSSSAEYSSTAFDSEEEEENMLSSDNTPRPNPTTKMGDVHMNMQIPTGKYHPSNYQLASPSPPITSHGPTRGVMSIPCPPRNLHIPSEREMKRGKREPTSAGTHERRSSDVKRKLLQYQRDVMAQARVTQSRGGNLGGMSMERKPDSPKLQPLGSPGPITPFELEEESGGYMLARGPRDSGGEGYGNMGDEQRGSRSPSVRV